MMGDKTSHNHAIFLLEELKICGSQTNFQQFHDGLDLQDRPFHQCVIIMDLASDDFIDWYISEETDIKANEGI
jgi:hypothetical protein